MFPTEINDNEIMEKALNYKKVGISSLITIVIICCIIFILASINTKKRNVYFSFDDVYICLENLTNNNYKSAFDEPFLKSLLQAHNKYNARFNLYVYTKVGSFDITDMPAKYKEEFQKSKDWLRFGFHAQNPDFSIPINDSVWTDSFSKTNYSIENFAGLGCISYNLRLHYFYADSTMMSVLKFNGVQGLLAADSPERISYTLPDSLNKKLVLSDKLNYLGFTIYKTDYRIEKMQLCNLYQNNGNDIVVFTHEWAYNNSWINRLKFQIMIGWYSLNNCNFKL